MNHPKTNHSFGPIMQLITEDFFSLAKLNISQHNQNKYYRIAVTSLTRIKYLINYLNKYPLLTSKENDFKD
jgi:hypothetical protein